MPETPTIRLLAFARYAELLGCSTMEIALPEPPTVDRLIEVVRALPGGEGLPPAVLVAVNARQAGGADHVAPGDEVAILPPMAGG